MEGILMYWSLRRQSQPNNYSSIPCQWVWLSPICWRAEFLVLSLFLILRSLLPLQYLGYVPSFLLFAHMSLKLFISSAHMRTALQFRVNSQFRYPDQAGKPQPTPSIHCACSHWLPPHKSTKVLSKFITGFQRNLQCFISRVWRHVFGFEEIFE